MSKGHKLWNILDEIDSDHAFLEKSSPDFSKTKRKIGSQLHDVGSSYFLKEPLHGLNVDLKVMPTFDKRVRMSREHFECIME